LRRLQKPEEASPEIQKIISDELAKLAPEVKATVKYQRLTRFTRLPDATSAREREHADA
jgi:hypothetical protein